MQTIINIIILIAAIKILDQTHSSLRPTLLYTFLRFVFGLLLDQQLIAVLIGTLISFVLIFVYFWLLNKLRGSFLGWLVLVLGLVDWFNLKIQGSLKLSPRQKEFSLSSHLHK